MDRPGSGRGPRRPPPAQTLPAGVPPPPPPPPLPGQGYQGRKVDRQKSDSSDSSQGYVGSGQDSDSSGSYHTAPAQSIRGRHVRQASQDSDYQSGSDDQDDLHYDPSCTFMSHKLSDSDIYNRTRLLKAREKIIKEMRNLYAQEWMQCNGDVLLKGLRDPEYAKDSGIRTVIVIGGELVQLVPPDPNSSIAPQTLALYTSYVDKALSSMLQTLPSYETLKKEISNNESVLKKAREKLKNEYKVLVKKRVEKALLVNTSVVFIIRNGRGMVTGELQRSATIPDSALSKKETATLKPDALIVDSDYKDSFGDGIRRSGIRPDWHGFQQQAGDEELEESDPFYSNSSTNSMQGAPLLQAPPHFSPAGSVVSQKEPMPAVDDMSQRPASEVNQETQEVDSSDVDADDESEKDDDSLYSAPDDLLLPEGDKNWVVNPISNMQTETPEPEDDTRSNASTLRPSIDIKSGDEADDEKDADT